MAEATDDNFLVARFNQGDDRAFTEIYKRFYRRIYVTCIKTIYPKGTPEDAKDIVNITFLKLYKRRDKITSMGAITNFLYLALRTGSIDFLRKAGKAVESPQDVSELQLINDELDGAFLERAMEEDRVREMVYALPERSRQVVVLYYLQGKKYREIGELLNISPRTVENQLRYALDKLRAVLTSKKAAGMVLLFAMGLIGTAMLWVTVCLLLHISGMLLNS